MITVRFDGSFEGWRSRARELLGERVPPHEVDWTSEREAPGLFDDASPPPAAGPAHRIRVPRPLLDELEMAARYRVEQRWSLLYRVLWRVTQGDSAARLPGDPDGSVLHARIKAVRREAHHLHAFLRFSPIATGDGPRHAAWFEPAHDILPWAAEHFAERMGGHSWLIATPTDGVRWDGSRLQHARPCPPAWRKMAMQAADPGGDLWKAYYESTFNPARLNRSVLESNLPVRFWKHLPEGMLIPQLMSRARAGAQRDGQAERVAGQPGKRIGRGQEKEA
jgi:probable DNA metabolism protein